MDLRASVQAELDRGEKLLWFGAPLPERVAEQEKGVGNASIFGAAFVVLWLCVIGFVGGSAAQAGAPIMFPLVASGMFLLGLFMLGHVLGLANSPAKAAAQARSTVYAVTDKRLLVLVAGQGARSYTPRDIERVERRDTPDGRGDVLFAREREDGYLDSNHHHHERWKELGFFGIENAREVERLIRTELLKS